MSNLFFSLGALFGALAVVLGAFASHALRQRLSDQKLNTFDTGVRYQFYHALALLAVGMAQSLRPDTGQFAAAGWLFVAGILFFSGSLYWLAFEGPRWLGPITPLGGLAFIGGWVLLILG